MRRRARGGLRRSRLRRRTAPASALGPFVCTAERPANLVARTSSFSPHLVEEGGARTSPRRMGGGAPQPGRPGRSHKCSASPVCRGRCLAGRRRPHRQHPGRGAHVRPPTSPSPASWTVVSCPRPRPWRSAPRTSRAPGHGRMPKTRWRRRWCCKSDGCRLRSAGLKMLTPRSPPSWPASGDARRSRGGLADRAGRAEAGATVEAGDARAPTRDPTRLSRSGRSAGTRG